MRPPAADSRSPERALALLAVVLLGGVAVVLALVQAGPLGDVALAYAFPLGGALYVVTGLLAWWRRPANRLGALLVAGGVAWLAASLANTAVPVLIAAGTVTAVLPVTLVLHLLHATPGGRVRGRASQVLVGAAYVVGLVLQAPLWAFRPQPPPYDLLPAVDLPDLAQAGYRVQQVLGAVVVAATVWVLVRRLREYDRAQRQVLAPLFLYGILAVVAVPLVANVLRPLLGLGDEATAALQLAALLTVPLGFLGVVLRGGFARTGELSAFVTSVAASSGTGRALEEAVGATLGDPRARLLRWSATRDSYVDADGVPVPVDGGGGRTVVHVEAADRRLGALVYDPRLGADPATVTAVGRVVAIALDRERLAGEVSESRRALREASSRLLERDDSQRRQLARDLHDGLQVQLVLLSLQARRLADDLGPGEGASRAARFADDVDQAAAGLRSIVAGVLPAPLVERGLTSAVQELAYDLPLLITVDAAGLPDRLPPSLESTAYFTVAEGLTNVVKHSGARSVRVCLRWAEDALLLDVEDDGHGGARTDGDGSGLPGLRDRVHVLGGSLTVDSDRTGTRLRAVLPRGS